MEPTLRDGDLLLVRVGAQPGAGRLVVRRGCPDVRPLAVKRLVRARAEGWWVERDNPREGVDSWVVGAVPTGRRRGAGGGHEFGHLGASDRPQLYDTMALRSHRRSVRRDSI